jgi:tetraacyldisaccharide 4'-kinase
LLDLLSGQAMRLRRRRTERRPQLQRRLAKPVISVGNLSVGGTGKTPVVAEIARRLIAAGHRPSILSRGYARADAVDGVVVAADGHRILATVDLAGDEPLMLARQVPGAIVCVCPDRYLAGTLAENRLGCTVHILDDGFQHLELARDLDVLVTTIGEIPNGRVIPMGRLREPKDAARRADVLVVSNASAEEAAQEAEKLGIRLSCGAQRGLGEPILIAAVVPKVSAFAAAGRSGETSPELAHSSASVGGPGVRVLAVAGIGNPKRFFEALGRSYDVVETMGFADHHRYRNADVAAIEAKRVAVNADVVLTTDKDAVRLETLSLPFDAYRVPLQVTFDPVEALMAPVMAAAAAAAGAPKVFR